MRKITGPDFPGISKPSTDFGALIDGRRSYLSMIVIDLSVARNFGNGTAGQFRIAGNSFFVDQGGDVGNARVIFENVQDDSSLSANLNGGAVAVAPLVNAGFVIKVPFTSIRVQNGVQAGKVLRVFYGVDVDFTPSLNANLAITGTVNAINYGQTYGASYKSNTAMLANTPDTVFTGAANVNGAYVWSAAAVTTCAAINTGSYLAKATAPASAIDGDVIYLASALAGQCSNGSQMPNAIFIAAGKGLFWISTGNEAAPCLREVLYTLL